MLRPATALVDFRICTTDGDIGTVDDFYFDDDKWTIRYLVVDTGTYFPRRRVLISPMAIDRVDWYRGDVRLTITRRAVETSPDPGSNRPVSRQYERQHLRHYGWPHYWGSSSLWGVGPFPRELATLPRQEWPREKEETGDPHLRSIHEVTRYHVRGSDGEIGRVEDFLIDDRTWAIRYLVVNTRNWWVGKSVLLAPMRARHISWEQRKVFIDVACDVIRSAPEWIAGTAMTREYEARINAHFARRFEQGSGVAEKPLGS